MTYDSWKTRSPDDELSYQEPPLVITTCPDCDGSGEKLTAIWVYEHGCGFGHDDVHGEPCPLCGGQGFLIEESQGDQ
jgi:DnaJ-class molecular chaperone